MMQQKRLLMSAIKQLYQGTEMIPIWDIKCFIMKINNFFSKLKLVKKHNLSFICDLLWFALFVTGLLS